MAQLHRLRRLTIVAALSALLVASPASAQPVPAKADPDVLCLLAVGAASDGADKADAEVFNNLIMYFGAIASTRYADDAALDGAVKAVALDLPARDLDATVKDCVDRFTVQMGRIGKSMDKIAS